MHSEETATVTSSEPDDQRTGLMVFCACLSLSSCPVTLPATHGHSTPPTPHSDGLWHTSIGLRLPADLTLPFFPARKIPEGSSRA